MTIYDVIDEAQEAFHNSEFYFNGESPAQRIVFWRIWVKAWEEALIAQGVLERVPAFIPPEAAKAEGAVLSAAEQREGRHLQHAERHALIKEGVEFELVGLDAKRDPRY